MNILFMSNLNRIIILLVLFFALFVLFKSESVLAQQIDANPNPVVVTLGQQGSTTITWDTVADVLNASIYVSINGIRGAQPFATGLTGTQVADFIEPGNTYVFTLWGQNKTINLASVTVETKKRYPKPIIKPQHKNIKIERHGTYADINFDTNFDTYPFVMVSENNPNDNTLSSTASNQKVPAFNPDDIIFSKFITPRGREHSTRLNKLKPNTTYHYAIVSYDRDETGRYARYYGTFQTLERVVQVKFDKITVLDDSDDLSDGDFLFYFFINKEEVFTKKSQVGTGETTNIFITRTRTENNFDSVELRVAGVDDDTMETPYNLPTYYPPSSMILKHNEYITDNFEWTVAKRKINITPDTADKFSKIDSDEESFTRKFTMIAVPKKKSLIRSKVKFSVEGNLKVSYK